jgi:hypothetical protein
MFNGITVNLKNSANDLVFDFDLPVGSAECWPMILMQMVTDLRRC